jgi:hypothetical protein
VILIRDREYVCEEGFWSGVDAWAGQVGLTAPVDIVQASEMPGPG